jgi:pentatricopeptide repeat protein
MHLIIEAQVFEFIINDEEAGYDELLLTLYSDTILLLGKNKMIETVEEMFNRVVEKGLKPDTRLFNEMIGAYLQVGNTEKAMDFYRSMKDSGCLPDELTFTILIRSLLKNGEHELVETLKKESFDYVNAPGKFVQKVQQTHVRFQILFCYVMQLLFSLSLVFHVIFWNYMGRVIQLVNLVLYFGILNSVMLCK